MMRVTNETTKKIGAKLIHANPLPIKSPKRKKIQLKIQLSLCMQYNIHA